MQRGDRRVEKRPRPLQEVGGAPGECESTAWHPTDPNVLTSVRSVHAVLRLTGFSTTDGPLCKISPPMGPTLCLKIAVASH